MRQARHEYDEPDGFAQIDTLFSLAEAYLFMQLVELKDARPELLPPGRDNADIYRYIGSCRCWYRPGTAARQNTNVHTA